MKGTRKFYGVLSHDCEKIGCDDYAPEIKIIRDTWEEAFDDLLNIIRRDYFENMEELEENEGKIFGITPYQEYLFPACKEDDDRGKGWTTEELKEHIRWNGYYSIGITVFHIMKLEYPQ